MGPRSLLYILRASLFSAILLTFLLVGREMGVFIPALSATLEEIPGLILGLSALLLYMVAAASFVTYFEYHGFGPQDGIIRRGPDRKVAALTFDDGPHPEYTSEILDILKEKKVKAAFFLVGQHVEKYPEVARRIVEEGHEVGNHTYTHKDVFSLSKEAIRSEIRRAQEAIYNTTGVRTTWFRPPRGAYRESGKRLILDAGFTMALWSISSLDWRRVKPSVVAKRIMRYLHPGAIILFHDSGSLVKPEGGNRSNTVKCLPLVIDEIRKRGYRIVSLYELKELKEEERSQQAAYERSVV